MKCLDEQKTNWSAVAMKIIKRGLPFIIGAFIGSLVVFFIKPNLVNDVSEIAEKLSEDKSELIISESEKPQEIYCPPQEVKEKIVYKTVYKDRIVYVPKKIKPGCHVDWQTGHITASVERGAYLKCIIDYTSKHLDVDYRIRQKQAIERINNLPTKQMIR